MLLSVVLVVVGVGLLYWGGEILVDNSIRLAKSFGVSSLVIGLTVVAFATSAPELAATITAALRGAPDIAIGNVFGSNIANLGLILGTAALIFPLYATVRFIRREVAFMVFVTIVIYPLMATGNYLSWFEGAFLVVMLGIFLWTQIRETRDDKDDDEGDEGQRPAWLSAVVLFGSLSWQTHQHAKSHTTIATCSSFLASSFASLGFNISTKERHFSNNP